MKWIWRNRNWKNDSRHLEAGSSHLRTDSQDLETNPQWLNTDFNQGWTPIQTLKNDSRQVETNPHTENPKPDSVIKKNDPVYTDAFAGYLCSICYLAVSDLYLTPFSDLSWLVVLQPPNDDSQPLHNVSNLCVLARHLYSVSLGWEFWNHLSCH